MKNFIKILSVVLCITLLCSCTKNTETNTLEIKNRLIILALGIDKADNGEILVSVQALNTDVSSNASSQSAPENIVKCYTQKGHSISQAISKLSDLTGKTPLLSQNRIVVLGWDFALEGISNYLDDFVRNVENRSSVLVMVSQTTAKDVVFAKSSENVISARLCEQIIETSSEQSYMVNTRVYELINNLIDDKSCCGVPVIKLKNKEKEDEIYTDSVAIFKNDSVKSVQNLDVVKGIIFANNRVRFGEISFDYQDSNITATVLKSDTIVKTEIQGNKPVFTLKINTFVNISEINNDIKSKVKESDINTIQKLAAQDIKEFVEKSIKECIIKNETDVFGFGKRLMRTKPKYYKNYVDDWSEDMSSAEFNVEVKVRVKGMGDSAAIMQGA